MWMLTWWRHRAVVSKVGADGVDVTVVMEVSCWTTEQGVVPYQELQESDPGVYYAKRWWQRPGEVVLHHK